jgi:hypothetical protein
MFTGSAAIAQDTSVKSDAELLKGLSKEKLYRSAINDETIPPNAKRAFIVYIGSFQQAKLNEQLAKLTQLEELQLEIRAFEELSFGFLTELPNLKILTISFCVPGEGIFQKSWENARPLDLSFLKKFPELRILSLRWSGAFINPDAVLSLPKLIYLGIPYFSFNPVFVQNKSLQQIELGEGETLLLSKKPNWSVAVGWPGRGSDRSNIELFSEEDIQYADFLKQMKILSKSQPDEWTLPIVKTDSLGDTLFFLSEISEQTIFWEIRHLNGDGTISGKMLQKEDGTNLLFNRFEAFDSKIGIEVVREGNSTNVIRYFHRGPYWAELTRIEETNYFNDQLDGVSLIYYPNKTIKERRMYKLGKQIGETEVFDLNGHLIRENQ